ncbi:DUF4350 domain-containing protein [Novosphingobium sp. TH158]|uniref:DUF4350 domain-containing protein n=1 Tax=Novosphingobium sp. TH158 TaxID=2067455 RepID=UPI000C7DD00F|nr:DUF4350 domain-containing protein [Novosphingobium sp. TH158]PLK26404.1 ABC transporter [Novosphingobium sp. TH158]
MAAALLAALGACNGKAQGNRSIAVMTSLPILWDEHADISATLQQSDATPHWARSELEARGKLRPLDVVSDESLRGTDIAVLAQPRPLAPEEMVALDRWVRSGGRLLLLADPMLTAESIFPVGDGRRPQAIAMVDPLLAHWGLELRFDERTPPGERLAEAEGLEIPVNLPGAFKAGQGSCTITAAGLVARCRPGKGLAIIVADAALLEPRDGERAKPAAKAFAGLVGLVENSR